MSKNARQQYRLTQDELASLSTARQTREAMHALMRCEAIQGVGGTPVIYYNMHHGFLVLDLLDEEDRQLNEAIEPHTLPFASRITNEIFE